MQSKNILSLVLAVLFLTSSFLVSAQNTLSSPYTKYGIGEVGLYSNAVTSAMGGVGYTLQRNNMVNHYNNTTANTQKIIDDTCIDFVLPWGTAIQNLRSIEDARETDI